LDRRPIPGEAEDFDSFGVVAAEAALAALPILGLDLEAVGVEEFGLAVWDCHLVSPVEVVHAGKMMDHQKTQVVGQDDVETRCDRALQLLVASLVPSVAASGDRLA